MKTRVLAVSALAALTLAACGEAPSDEGATGGATGGTAAADFLGCMVTDQGGIDDRSFNASAWEGLQAAEQDLGIQVKYVTSKSESDYTPNVNSLVAEDCGIIVTVGFSLGDATLTAAQANADEKFAIVDENPDADPDTDGVQPTENIKPLLFNTAEAAYLAGYLSAGMSESGTVGTFGGIKLPTVAVFMDGFADGVAKYNEDKGADVKLLGWDKAKQDGLFAGKFDSPTDGKNLASNLIQQGADIIMPVAGGTGLGAAQAAQESGGKVAIVWVDTDGYESASQYKEVFLTTVEKGIANAVETATVETVNGQFTNTPFIGTLANDGVGLAPYHDFESKVPAELSAEVEALKEQIIDGTIVVESANSPQT
ncbi:MAG: BMP family ABC transporter substrate-binding protein [Candidatus Nanopelagicales bacterium]|jgi:basic membrane protein A|nr:BMP family ABC transporter substrate-binding protein [Candidatus Nanopelagicales bacterium]